MKRKLLKACALEYREGMNAPVVRAMGKGDLAKQIIILAQKHGIEILEEESEELFTILETIPLHEEIPPEIYLAVARIFAFLYEKQNGESFV